MIKYDVCENEATIIEKANGRVYGAVCGVCVGDNLEDADEFSSMPF